jgi:glucose-1-phosphate cytidylyltransferase
MKVVILAGGFGTRLSEYTDTVPKPMVTVGGRPIIWHIMNWYAKHGFSDFVLALGYKANLFKEYFLNFNRINSDFKIDLSSGEVEILGSDLNIDWTVSLIDTGVKTMTGGRLKKLQEHLGGETFLLTYGDGVANVDICELINFHRSHGKMVTVTAVHPAARFGELHLNNGVVEQFLEKPQTEDGWINGGFFVVEPAFLNFIEASDTILEKAPLETVCAMGELMAYRHNGFWQCMDTKRDRDLLEKLWLTGDAPWVTE